MISLFTIGIIFAYILEGSNLMKATVIISTIPLALAGNILRITSILIVANKYGQEAAINYFHDFSSLLLFSVALIGLFLVGGCFGRLRFKKIF
jgi:exosortase/archaeosortase family protein